MLPFEIIDFQNAKHGFYCEGCIRGKAKRKNIPKRSVRSSVEIGELIFSDVYGPTKVPSVGGNRYMVTFTDDYSRTAKIFGIPTKGKTEEVFRTYYKMMKTNGVKIKKIRSDNGGEYKGKFSDFCRRKGITQEFTAPESPWQNAVSERLNRTLEGAAKACLAGKNLTGKLWLAAMNHFLDTKERLERKEPILQQAFGDKVFYLNHRKQKHEEKVLEGIFIGSEDKNRVINVGNCPFSDKIGMTIL